MASARLQHPFLGAIQGIQVHNRLIQFRSLPYGFIGQRFARSQKLDYLPGPKPYDATKVGPQSIQAFNSAHVDAKSNQLPQDVEEQDQSEDCLRATITRPKDYDGSAKLPVLVFLHGGAFALGSGERRYYSPLSLCAHAIEMGKPLLFVSLNYRLGALGFFHSSEASDLMPPNNGLHDQITGFDWLHRNIAGFGGDPDNITAIGQSAGGESVSLHNLSGRKMPLYKRSIAFAGTPLTMPDKTPQEHQENFINQAKKLGIDVEDRSSEAIAKDMISYDVAKIRDLGYVGQPCVESELIPQKEHATMRAISAGQVSQVSWLECQIISSAGYDGSISNIMTRQDKKRKDHAKGFIAIAREVLKYPDELLRIYNISQDTPDEEALETICQFESDIGFFAAALSVAEGTSDKTKTFFQLFDLGNPFEGFLETGRYATHTWDIVAFLGAYEERLSDDYRRKIREWRERCIGYIADGTDPWPSMEGKDGKMLVLDKNGTREEELNDVLSGRRAALLDLARREGPDGRDMLWEGVCRHWLMKGQ